MKRLIYAIVTASAMISVSVLASQPTDINYSSKGTTALGIEYSTYTVKCSDGSKRKITSWDKRKKWCIGTSRKCTNDQLRTAKQACSQK